MSILSASQLKLSYGELDVFSGIGLEVTDRACIGIVGPNGGGKTSLVRILIGELEPDRGTVVQTDGLRVGYVPQMPDHATDGTLRDVVMTAFDKLRRLEDDLASSALEIQRADPGGRRQAERRYSSLLQQYEALGGYDYMNLMERVVVGVGLPLETLETPVASVSGGERTRAALATALLADPDLLLLDEPTNYLDFKGLEWLEGFLARFGHAFIVISHDRFFLDQVATEIWELENGRLKTFRGNFAKYRSFKAEQAKLQAREFERQQEFIAKEEAFIRRYHAGQRAREARGRETRLARLERIEAPQREESVHISSIDASRTGHIVLSTHDLKVGYTQDHHRVQLLAADDMQLERGSRTAVVGSNGIGKTTLLQTILGLIPSLSGTVTLGHNVKVGYHRQGTDGLPRDSTVLEALLNARNIPIAEARDRLAWFLFRGDDVFAPVSSLSGGERTRLALARLLVTEPNVLLLDEPTTHLDIPSREALEQALLAYHGALLFVSHDRHLISLLAEQLWLVGDGGVSHFPGGFREWMRETQPEPKPQSNSAARKARARRRQLATAVKEQEAPAVPRPDPETVIQELEEWLAEIGREIEAETESQDVTEIVRLGKEYAELQARLEDALEQWRE